MRDLTFTPEIKSMDTVRFIIHRKAAFFGALLPHRIFINGQFAGMVHSGKTICTEIPRADAYYIDDDESSGNAVIFDNGQSEYNILMKVLPGWRMPSCSEFYVENGIEPIKLPMFHFERILQADPAQFTPDERVLALCLECAWSVGEEVLSSKHPFEIIDALRTIGAAQFADLISGVIRREFPDVQFPLSENQMTQMQGRLDRAEREIGNAPGAYDEFRKAMAHYMMTRLNTPENIY